MLCTLEKPSDTSSRRRLGTGLALVLSLLWACGGGGDSGHQVKPPEPAIASITAAKETVTTGKSTTLTAVFSGGTGSINHGVNGVTSGVPISTGVLTADTDFTLTVTGPDGTTPAVGGCTVKVAPAPQVPVITGPAGSLLEGQTGCTASVPVQAGMTFAWTISGGTITGGNSTPQVTFTAGAAGTLQLACTATNAALEPSDAGKVSIQVQAMTGKPVIKSFTADRNLISQGGSVTLSWEVSQATYLEIGFNNQSVVVTGLTGATLSPGATTNYTLYAKNPLGDAVPLPPLTVTVIPALIPPVITVPSALTAGGSYTATVPAQTGVSYAWSVGNGQIAGGQGSPQLLFTAGASGTLALGCTLTNAATDTATQSRSLAIYPVPAASITANSTSPLFGAAVTLTPVFTGASTAWVGTSSGGKNITASAVSGSAITIPAITVPTTYYLTVTSAAGDTSSDSVTVTPQTVVLGAITPASSTLTVSKSISFGCAVTGGAKSTLTWSAKAGGVEVGSWSGSTWKAPATATVAVTIVATSDDDPTKTTSTPATATVVAAPAATSLTASLASLAYGATFTLTPVYSGGTGVITDHLGNSIPCPATGVATATIAANWSGARIYTLTVTNAAGDATKAAATVTPIEPIMSVFDSTSVTNSGNCTPVGAPFPVTFTYTVYVVEVGGTWDSGTLTAPNGAHTWTLASCSGGTVNVASPGSVTNGSTGPCPSLTFHFCPEAIGVWTLSVTRSGVTRVWTYNLSLASGDTAGGTCAW